jgi:hypothetical protein
MRPLAQTEEARTKDLLAFVRALGRAMTAREKNPELVDAIRTVIQLYAPPSAGVSTRNLPRSQARKLEDARE